MGIRQLDVFALTHYTENKRHPYPSTNLQIRKTRKITLKNNYPTPVEVWKNNS